MNNSHKTAISRSDCSKPLKILLNGCDGWENGLIDPSCSSILDWGCGKGADIIHLNELGFDTYGYDPYFSPTLPSKKYDVGICNYVLNVIQDPKERSRTINQMMSYIKDDGYAFISVRGINLGNTSKWVVCGDGWITSRGTFQTGFDIGKLWATLDGVGDKFLIKSTKTMLIVGIHNG